MSTEKPDYQYVGDVKKLLSKITDWDEGYFDVKHREGVSSGGNVYTYIRINIGTGDMYDRQKKAEICKKLDNANVEHRTELPIREGYYTVDIPINEYLSTNGIEELDKKFHAGTAKPFTDKVKAVTSTLDGEKKRQKIREFLDAASGQLGISFTPSLLDESGKWNNLTGPYKKVTGQPPEIDIDAVRKFSKIGKEVDRSAQL